MKRETQPQILLKSCCAALAVAATIMLAGPGIAPAQAQTLQVLHSFTSGAGGAFPFAGVTLDQQGRIYGTTSEGGSHDDGVVYRLVRQGEGWIFSPIYSFGSQEHDGSYPVARVILGPDGLLYGTTNYGGVEGSGTVFRLQPPATVCKNVLCPWLETVLYSFTGGADGAYPEYGDLSFDHSGNLYGTTGGGGSSGCGVVFKLTRSGSSWTESVVWNFNGVNDGCGPISGVIFDSAGNLYGTTSSGGPGNFGTAYELSPTQSGWTQTTLHAFGGIYAAGGLIWDAHGDLFGITGADFGGGEGAAYELTPQNGSWSFTLLQDFGSEYIAPLAAPSFDSQGNLYGPLPTGGGDGFGEIFKLTPSGNQWLYSQFYQFTELGAAGIFPIGAVTFDVDGNMYGTSEQGAGAGTVWEITP